MHVLIYMHALCCTCAPPPLTLSLLQLSGEWFVKGRNGKMWWGGTSDDFDDLMDYLEESERSPTFVDFGQYNAYFVTHE